MKIGRNEDCPCGSGKKYKKCCLIKKDKNRETKEAVNKLYASLKKVNNDLLIKANEPDYVAANFDNAMQLTITSNALSLVKSFMQNNHYSVTNALNMRNIIECTALILMNNAGDITERHKELFVEQYKLIEYKSYKSLKELDYREFLNFSQLKKAYDEAKQIYQKDGMSNSEFKKCINSRLPFLCDEKLSFDGLIKKYCKGFLQPYIVLSRMIHPSSYDKFGHEEYYNTFTGLIIGFLIITYGNIKAEKELDFYAEEKLIYGFFIDTPDNYGKQLLDIQKSQWQILKDIAKMFDKKYEESSYVSNFLGEIVLVLHDINTDSHRGYTENAKLKFKVIAEMFACFNKIYFVSNRDEGEYLYDMLLKHDIYKDWELHDYKATDKDYLYDYYKKNYPNSSLDIDEFLEKFSKSLGFLINEKGEVPSFSKLAKDYFEEIGKSHIVLNIDLSAKDFFWLLYLESQNMSHGCGYLFFANTGAWLDDTNVINFLDNAVLQLLLKMHMLFSLYSIVEDKNLDISNLLKQKIPLMNELIKKKVKLQSIKNVPKEF